MMGNIKLAKWLPIIALFVLLDGTSALFKLVPDTRVKSFHCINGKYIFSTWFCDGINDCEDASDESYGCNREKCGEGSFTCDNSQCLPIEVRCNGLVQCADGSDEKYCDHEPSFDNCTTTKGKFLCKDKLRCIDLSKVCDGENHCFDSSDETDKCYQYDPKICNLCPHACYRTPYGPFCSYNHTIDEYHDLSDEFNDCDDSENNCEQKCVKFQGKTQCSCEENFSLRNNFLQPLHCEENDISKDMLVYTVQGEIRGIPAYGNESVIIQEMKDENITAISAANESVYWGGLYGGDKAIGKVSFSGKNFAVIVSEGIDDVTAMDIDWRTGNVYFIDNVKKRIAACTNDGKRCIEIHKLKNSATSISLAPRLGWMFYSVWNDDEDGFTINRSNMNGGKSYYNIRTGLRDVTCLSADETSEKLYWLDAVRRRIEMIRFDLYDKSTKVFKADLRMNYASITVNARYLYWIMKNNGAIYYTAGYHVQPKIALNGTNPVRLIYGYSHSEKTTQMTPPCSWGCKGICLLQHRYVNKTGSYCLCDNATDVEDNGIWCRENIKSFSSDYDIDHELFPYPRPAVRNYSLRIVLVVISFIVIIAGVAFYLHRKGYLHNVAMFRHSRM